MRNLRLRRRSWSGIWGMFKGLLKWNDAKNPAEARIYLLTLREARLNRATRLFASILLDQIVFVKSFACFFVFFVVESPELLENIMKLPKNFRVSPEQLKVLRDLDVYLRMTIEKYKLNSKKLKNE